MSKGSSKRRAEQFARQQAMTSSNPIIRQAASRIDNATITTETASNASVTDLYGKLANEYKAQFIYRLVLGSPWLNELCPDWFVNSAGIRDVEAWNKARKKGIDAARAGIFTQKTIYVVNDKGEETKETAYVVPAPVNAAMIARMVEIGNMEAVLECGRIFVDESTVKAMDMPAGIAHRAAMLGGILEYSKNVHTIIMRAYDLSKAQAAYDKAQASYDLNRLDEKLMKRRDIAATKLLAAQNAFDAAWLAVHKIESSANESAPIVEAPTMEAITA